ncbi:DUF2306 domain-containing protein [Persicitalea jodogahamensis]|uniref:DUF2306 domain-containing protein n=1 Tax=Persicitalea jodogahamensis TaxID=402147 RepID=A0A8J3G7R8_9BACT|nr:DUF2306 domain-containing protein [Persicitalea jodogahamensis]GHB52165.1 hypothetical protein GCM10007390_01000 [Persicitalea jodogahamensis]
MEPYKIILLIHVAFGFSALATGIVPMVAKKGGKVHKFWGNVYYWSMFGVFVTTLMLFALKPKELKLQFFLGIAVLSFYFTFSGDRVLKMKKSATQATVLDRVAAGLALACGLAMLAYAVYGIIGLQNYFIAILFTVFGVLISVNARHDLQLFSGKIESGKMHWYFGHIAKIMGAYIATVTAFCVNMTRYLPEDSSVYLQLIPWLAPGILLGVGTAYYSKRQKEKRNMPVKFGFLTGMVRRVLVR